jgi:hypothetical protein
MKDDSDLSKGMRGKFYRGDATLVAPVRLEPEGRR